MSSMAAGVKCRNFKVLVLENEDYKNSFNCYLQAKADFQEEKLCESLIEFLLLSSQMQKD